MLRRLTDKFRRSKYRILLAQEDDFGPIAELHALSFPRGWSEVEIANLANQDACILLVTKRIGRPNEPLMGFNLLRRTGDEAEILSVATHPKVRGRGMGRDLMREALRILQSERVKTLFLEVDDANKPAISLYQKLGFETVGNRPGYYAQSGHKNTGKPATALVMKLDLV